MHWIACLDGGPRRVNHAAAAVGKLIYSFGGYCTGEDSKISRPMDVHTLHTDTLRWARVPLAQYDRDAVPFQRYGHTAVAHEAKVYVWGGRNDERACNTMYVFDTATHRWSAPPVKGYKPAARDGHSACILRGRMYIFGGFEELDESFSQDVHQFDLRTMTWCTYDTVSIVPILRDFHSAAVVEHVPCLADTMLIFGGRGERSYSLYNRTEELYSPQIETLDVRSHAWRSPFTSGDMPTGRRSHSAFVHKEYMYIFGGYNGNMDRHFNDLYRFDAAKHVWTRMQPIGTPPCERRRQCCIVVGDRMFLFGGTSPTVDKPRRRRRNSTNSDSDNGYDDTADLMDHNDLHVLDLNPTLKTLSMLAVVQRNLDYTCLPASLQFEIQMLTTPNNITKPVEEVEEELLLLVDT